MTKISTVGQLKEFSNMLGGVPYMQHVAGNIQEKEKSVSITNSITGAKEVSLER